MYRFTSELPKEEYDNFILNYSMASLTQTYNWANIKSNWRHFHCGLYKDDTLVGVCLILVKKMIKGLNMFFVPRGYLIDFTNYEDLEEMTKNIKELAKKTHAYVVKIDPNFCKRQYSFKGDEINTNYDKDYQVKHNNLLKLGYKSLGPQKEMGKSMEPNYNMLAPICDNSNKVLTLEELLSTYKSKFKYYIGSFHEKRGITFEITSDINKVGILVSLLKETEEKQNISLRNEEYFVNLMKNYPTARLVFGTINLPKYLKFLEENNGKSTEIEEVKELLKTHEENMVLSSSIMFLPSNKNGIRTSEYLYAGNSLSLTKIRVSTGVVFEIIKFSLENNCHYCNLGGIDGNLNDHLTSFKEKFNGEVLEFAGEYDLPIKWIYYPIKVMYPILLKIYKIIR
jgi:serine/alanine adding enzyme